MPNTPNVLYLHSHDTGRFIQPYGYAVPTPNLQKLARQGVLFTECHAAAPTCSPSRAAMLTGQSAHGSGMIGLTNRGFGMEDYTRHIVHTLRKGGYRSTLIGIQHVAKDSESIGYDRVAATTDAEQTCRAAEEFLASAPEEPFFLSVGFATTHREFAEPSGVDPQNPDYCRPAPPLPNTPRTRYDMACYKASARQLDREMGRVLDALEANGLAQHTLVLCTTDHGIAFPRMKCNLTDGGTGVFLIMRGPGQFRGRRVIDALLSQVDLFPSLCDYLDLEPPGWLEGTSMLPLLRGEAEEINEEVFSEVTYHAAYEPQRAVRTRRWKYIRRFGERAAQVVLPNCDEAPSKEVWLEHGWGDREVAPEQLYDLAFDPHEMNNLAEDPGSAEVLERMRERLDEWMSRTHDPILEAEPVPAPPDARLNNPEDVSVMDPLGPPPAVREPEED